MRGYLERFGTISSLEFDPETGTGSVGYSTYGAVTKAIQAMNGVTIEGNIFFISDTSDRTKKAANYNNLFVGNVDPSIKEDELKEEFSKYGEIESLLRPTRDDPDSDNPKKTINKPFIYVSFKDSKVASNVIKELDGKVRWGRELDINYYDPDAKRGHKKAQKPQNTQNFEEMTQSFFNALINMAGSMNNNMNRGRGGYNSHNQDYRGNSYNRGRGGRGNYRGRGSRGGMRGAPQGGHYNQRSQYEKPIMPNSMPPMMGVPPPVGPPPVSMTPGGGASIGGPHPGAPPTGLPPAHAPTHFGMEVSAPPTMAPQAPPAMPSHNTQAPPSMPAHTTQAPSAMPPPMSHPPQATEAPPMQAPVGEKELSGFTMQALEALTDDERENTIGTALYNKLDPLCGGDVAGKITGMFLDLPLEEVFEIATEEATFQKYYNDAMELIQNDNTQG